MTPKQYLRWAYRLNELINSHIREVEQLGSFNKCFKYRFSKERVQGAAQDRISNIIAKLLTLKSKSMMK